MNASLSRKTRGLSLADITAYTGIAKSNLPLLANNPHPNPTIDTLCRYADAVGKEMVLTLVTNPTRANDADKESRQVAVTGYGLAPCCTTCSSAR